MRLPQGWTVYGPVSMEQTGSIVVANRVVARQVEDLQELVVDMFKRDCIDATHAMNPDVKALSPLDEQLYKLMEERVRFRDGHYEAPIPLKGDRQGLPNNKKQAMIRLRWQRKKMEKDDDYRKEYVSFMEGLIDQGHAERAWETGDSESWFLPHHGVRHPTKRKLRVVLDASARCESTCLNDQLIEGPNLTNGLLGVFHRFRRYAVAMSGDIEKMFYQIMVPAAERHLLKFLWWPGGDLAAPVGEYRMCVHPFGAVSSPEVANYILKRVGRADGLKDNVSKTITQDFYVDDVLTSVETVEEARALCHDLKEACRRGGFNLTKFVSTHAGALDLLQEKDKVHRKEQVNLASDGLRVERALGVVWDVREDVFKFCSQPQQKDFTRRGVLSIISAVYEPLGFLGPVMLPARKLLQTLCKANNLGWDDVIPSTYYSSWARWLGQL